MTGRTYIPAAGHDWLLPLYDPFNRWLGVETMHRRLIGQAGIQPDQRVLEIGCGTGNLTILARRLHPHTEVVGIDPDPKALTRARRKATQGEAHVQFVLGYAEKLPFPEGSFDSVLSALMFHHLPANTKSSALREVRRVLKPTGVLHLVDFVAGDEPSGGLLSHLFHQGQASRLDVADAIPSLMEKAGLGEVAEITYRPLVAGRIVSYQAARPVSSVSTATAQ